MSCTQFIPIIGSVIGGCIAACAGMVLAHWKWRRDGRDRFMLAIAEFDADLPDHIGDLRAFHTSTLRPLRYAIHAVQPFVCAAQFTSLRDLWSEYRKLGHKQLDLDLTSIEQMLDDDDTPLPTKRADERLAEFYDRFKAAVD